LLLNLGKFDSILELACGTGIWTETLLQMGKEVTAVDAGPEMLAIARQKLGEERIQYQQADLFHWEPAQRYDLLFFANWLSHVPPQALDEFLGKVQQAVRPGGQIAIIDQHQPSDSDKRAAKDAIYATRPVEDGRQFTIVKAFYDLPPLQNKLEGLGFEISINKFTNTFFFLTGKNRIA
jgi:2-polyprenyl-3-methyl-5-hydroxy-6-metoxy-1,4-benzoquinol methylase